MVKTDDELYERKFDVGVLYEWPEIQYNTCHSKCLRMSLLEDGRWIGKDYRGMPMPIEPCAVLFNAMMTTPYHEVDTSCR